MKKYFLALIIVFIIIVTSIIIAFKFSPEKQNTNSQNTKTANEIKNDEIGYFYSDTCHYCQQQKPIIEELEKEGLKFKLMNIGENRELISQYNIEGTPTFIFKDKKLVGFQSKENIKKLWNENK